MSPAVGRRRRSRYADLHVRLRTEGGTPLRRALAVGLGTAVGCTPFYGLHFLVTTILARIFGLSRVIAYLAANLNNPLTLPFLLWIEIGLGHFLFDHEWPDLSLAALRHVDLLGLGRDLLVGSGVLGIVLGSLLAGLTYMLGAGRRDDAFTELREEAAQPYLEAGISHWEFVRGKLHYDPVYRRLVSRGILPRPGRLLDLGCGRGILLSLLTLIERRREGDGDDGGALAARYQGIELSPRLVRVARTSLGVAAEIHRGDLSRCEIQPCATAVLLDVLHYLPAEAQTRLLTRVTAVLEPGGLLVVREVDRAAGLGAWLTRASERLRAIFRLHLRQRFHYRPAADWRRLLAERGLAVELRDAAAGTPFANVLLLARKPDAPAQTEPRP